MKITLTGILMDDTPTKAGAITDPRKTLNVPKGTDVELRVNIVGQNGAPVDLSSAGTEVLLTIKKKPRQDWPRVVKQGSISGSMATFLIEPGDFAQALPGLFAYDVWLTKDGSRDPVIPTSPFNLLHSVAETPIRPPPPTVQLVANDTEPMILDFSGVNITGWVIEAHIGYITPLVRTAVLTDPVNGIAEVQWQVGDLQQGVWGGEIRITKPADGTQTSDEFIFDIRQSITGTNYLYFGASLPGADDEAFIKALANQPLCSSRQVEFNVTAGVGEYIYYAAPITYGSPVFVVDGFVGGFSQVATVMVTNLSGTQNYGLWKSDYPNLGLTNVKVL
jgi:hypothetical protein